MRQRFNDHGYSIGFPQPGHWHEVFNSDAYDGTKAGFPGTRAVLLPMGHDATGCHGRRALRYRRTACLYLLGIAAISTVRAVQRQSASIFCTPATQFGLRHGPRVIEPDNSFWVHED